MTESRNIIDYFYYWEHEAIKADLDKRRHNFSVLISNKFNDFNIGTVIRNCNAFLAKQILIYGRKKFDRRGAVGTYLYENIKHYDTVDDILDDNSGIIVAVDNVEGAVPIEDFDWPSEHTIMVFGQEQVGIPPELLERADHVVYIKQFGSVRSLNVGCASAIAMYDYCKQRIKDV
jgi:tRNA G18 (ribose-2'-O)-methylase SpoU